MFLTRLSGVVLLALACGLASLAIFILATTDVVLTDFGDPILWGAILVAFLVYPTLQKMGGAAIGASSQAKVWNIILSFAPAALFVVAFVFPFFGEHEFGLTSAAERFLGFIGALAVCKDFLGDLFMSAVKRQPERLVAN